MVLPNFQSPVLKIAIVVVCVVALAGMKYGLGWGNDCIAEKVVEEVVEKEIGTQITLPDLPTKAS